VQAFFLLLVWGLVPGWLAWLAEFMSTQEHAKYIINSPLSDN